MEYMIADKKKLEHLIRRGSFSPDLYTAWLLGDARVSQRDIDENILQGIEDHDQIVISDSLFCVIHGNAVKTKFGTFIGENYAGRCKIHMLYDTPTDVSDKVTLEPPNITKPIITISLPRLCYHAASKLVLVKGIKETEIALRLMTAFNGAVRASASLASISWAYPEIVEYAKNFEPTSHTVGFPSYSLEHPPVLAGRKLISILEYKYNIPENLEHDAGAKKEEMLHALSRIEKAQIRSLGEGSCRFQYCFCDVEGHMEKDIKDESLNQIITDLRDSIQTKKKSWYSGSTQFYVPLYGFSDLDTDRVQIGDTGVFIDKLRFYQPVFGKSKNGYNYAMPEELEKFLTDNRHLLEAQL